MPYFHLVFTLPAAIADIAYQNKAVIYELLFHASADTLVTIAADPKHLGARIGIISVLQTCGLALTHHPHLHVIVPGGGVSLDGARWVSCRPGFFLPVRVLSQLFRRLFLKKLLTAHEAGRLQLFGNHAPLADAQAFATYLAPLRRAEWVVYSKRPFRRPRGSAGLSLALYPSRRHLQQPLDRIRPARRHLQVEELPDRRPRSIQADDAHQRRVHPPNS